VYFSPLTHDFLHGRLDRSERRQGFVDALSQAVDDTVGRADHGEGGRSVREQRSLPSSLRVVELRVVKLAG
jgi:hypothetical protein